MAPTPVGGSITILEPATKTATPPKEAPCHPALFVLVVVYTLFQTCASSKFAAFNAALIPAFVALSVFVISNAILYLC